MMGLLTALARDTELLRVFRARLIDPDVADVTRVFERAVLRDEVSEDRNLDLQLSLFPALLIQKLLIFGELPQARFAERVVPDVILPLATAPTRTRTPNLAGR